MGKSFWLVGCILRHWRLSTGKHLAWRFINSSWIIITTYIGINILCRPCIFLLFWQWSSTISSNSLIGIVNILWNITVLFKTIRGCFIRSLSWCISRWLWRLNISILCWVQSIRSWFVYFNYFLSWKTIFRCLMLFLVAI